MADTPLKQYRAEKRITLAQLAADVGVTESHLSRVERKGTERLQMAMKLAEVTGLPVEAFARQ